MRRFLLFVLLLLMLPSSTTPWGFFAHRKINYYAVFTLPVEMMGFFKHHADLLASEAVQADRRRHTDKDEAPRHYIDLELFQEPLDSIPFYYPEAVERYTEDSLKAWGLVPWTILSTKYRLTEAMRNGDEEKILRYAADLGHYIADAHVPLHTTENYDGQQTGQNGIHGFWESRLPELYFDDFDLLTGKATYIEQPARSVRKIIRQSHNALDSVLRFEKELSQGKAESWKYSHEDRNGKTVRVYSERFSKKYHEKLSGMVERRLRASIKAVGDFWYTCWIDAGQPDLQPGKDAKPEVYDETAPDEKMEN